MDLVLAQAGGDSIMSWLAGLNLGLAGIGLWAFMSGRIVTGGALAKAEQRAEAAEARLRRIAEEDRQVLVPALTRATDVLTAYLERKADTPPPPSRSPR